MNRPAICLACTLIFASATLLSCRDARVVAFTEAQLQERFDSRFPVTATYFLVFTFTYSNPTIQFIEEQNRVRIGFNVRLDAETEVDGELVGGRIEVTTAIRFDSEKGELYLVDCEIERLTVEGVPQRVTNKLGELAGGTVNDMLSSSPILSLPDRGIKAAVARSLVEEVRIEQGELRIYLDRGRRKSDD